MTRETSIVQKHEEVRRNRKALLADLSSLVRVAKHLEKIANQHKPEDVVDEIYDDMLLKAFKIIIRGVKFLDAWNEEVGLDRAIQDLSSGNTFGSDSVPLTPPADISNGLRGNATGGSDVAAAQQTARRDSNGAIAQTLEPSQVNARPDSIRLNNRISVSHRISYTGPPAGFRNPNLASERLGAAYDSFLTLIGSFIGLHLQSRSSTELVTTTQQSVRSCKELLTIVDAIWEHDLQRSELLEQARNAMYDKITELVSATRDVFRASDQADEDMVFMPDQGKRLVDAATSCVRGAGDCVAKSRFVLERIGDFEFEPFGLGITSFEAPKSETAEERPASRSSNQNGPRSAEGSMRPPPPPLLIPSGSTLSEPTSSIIDSGSVVTPSTAVTSPLEGSVRSSINSVLPPLPQLSTPLISNDEFHTSDSSPVLPFHSCHVPGRGVASTGSGTSTYIGSMRDSETSGLSQASTRAASPDAFPHYKLGSYAGSHCTMAEEFQEAEAKVLEKTYAHELITNKAGQITGGTLPALIERLTTHDSTPDPVFVSTFYLTFRLFASPSQFAEALIDRFDYIAETSHVAGPVRLRVYNVFKGWLEAHWRPDCDKAALEIILAFSRKKLMLVLPTAGKRLTDLAEKVSLNNGPAAQTRLASSIGKTNTSTAQFVNPNAPLPTPMISKSQLSALKHWRQGGNTVNVLEFDPLELARQLTIKASAIFCSILPEELLATEWMKKSGSMAVNVRAMSTLSTDLTNLVIDCILQFEETKKRAQVIKQWVKIANKCLELNNYDSLMAIICSLNSSTILRLKRTWDLVSAKTKATLENLKSVIDVSKNYSGLRQRLQGLTPPCLPFVGVYLTDLTFVDVGNQTSRQLTDSRSGEAYSVINFDKHMKTAKIISELQRFQVPYRLTEIPELQTWMQDQLIRVRSTDLQSVQTNYRRSLLLEPREIPRSQPSPTESQFSIPSIRENGSKDRFDFLNWRNPKEKAVALGT